MVIKQQAIADRSFSFTATAGAFDMLADLSKGAAMSMLNQTKFYQWQQNGILFFTVLQPKDLMMPSTTSPVGYMDLVTSPKFNSMMNWYGIDDDKRRNSIKGWNDIIGWDSWLARKLK